MNGNFILGDIIEALIVQRNVDPEEICICTLGLNEENIDSLRNVLDLTTCRMWLLTSGFFYSHYKTTLVPYLYEQLDIDDRFQVAFGNYHSKVITIKTRHDHNIIIHGSANLRSSNSIEQMMIEAGNTELHDFNADIIKRICEKYGTIDYNRPIINRKKVESWQVVAAAAAGAVAGQERPQPRDAERPTM